MHSFDPGRYLRPLNIQPTGMSAAGGVAKPVDALLCDVYGTLLISGSGDIGAHHQDTDHPAELVRLMRHFGTRISPAQLASRMRDAVQADHVRAHSSGIEFPEVVIEKIWMDVLSLSSLESARRFAVEYELIVNPVWPMPGLRRLLHACRNSGVRLGIISNAQFYTPLIFQWLLGRSFAELGFDPNLLIFSYEQGRAKPSDALFELARRRLAAKAVPPVRTAFIGNDMRNDIAPAARQGFQTILFAGDRRSLRLRENEVDVQPNLIITELAQLVDQLT